jgi:hypothetical protein
MDDLAPMDEYGRARPQPVAVEVPPAVPEFGPALDSIVLQPVPRSPIVTAKRRKSAPCRTKAKHRKIDAVTQSKRDVNSRSNLLRLPAELRNYIHELVLFDASHRGEHDFATTGTTGCPYCPNGSSACVINLWCINKPDFDDFVQPPYTLVCHQLRDEALPMYYSNLIVCFHECDYKQSGLYFAVAREFLAAIGPRNRRLLQYVFFTGMEPTCSGPSEFRAAWGANMMAQIMDLVYNQVDEKTATVQHVLSEDEDEWKKDLNEDCWIFGCGKRCCGPDLWVQVKFE